MKGLTLTRHTVRCPLGDGTAGLTVQTDPDAAPSRRHRGVLSCSLAPSTPFVPPPPGYFLDLTPLVPYLHDVDPAPRHPLGVACSTPCLAMLNAAEPGAAEPVRCTSGVSDSLELARQTQSPAITRLLWLHGA